MKNLNIYRLIKEAENNNNFTDEELEQLFKTNNKVLFQIIIQEKEKTNLSSLAEIILKSKEDYFEAKHEDELGDFYKEINREIKNKVKNREEVKENIFNKIEVVKQYINQNEDTSFDSPNVIIFKLFLNEYNNKYSFTWRAFKEMKREYEKTHTLEGEDIYSLKRILEKDPNIEKVTNNTVFCKSNETLSDNIIEKIKNKIG